MLTERELATLRAALRYWQEELGPHGAEAMRPYYETDVVPLTSLEIDELRRFLKAATVRYAAYDQVAGELTGTLLFPTPEEALATSRETGRVATVLLPRA